MAMPAEKPPSAIRTVLPTCRARRSRAHASRASKAFSARTARRGGVGNTEKGSIDASQAGLPQARPIKRTNPEFTGSGVRLPPRAGGGLCQAGRRAGARYPSAGVFDGNLLNAGQQPAALLGLVQVPDLFETEGFGAGSLAQHAREAHAGQVAVRDGFD